MITVSWAGMGLVVYEKDAEGNLVQPLFSAISDSGGHPLESVIGEMARRITADEAMMKKMSEVLMEHTISLGDENLYDSPNEDVIMVLAEYLAYISLRQPKEAING